MKDFKGLITRQQIMRLFYEFLLFLFGITVETSTQSHISRA